MALWVWDTHVREDGLPPALTPGAVATQRGKALGFLDDIARELDDFVGRWEQTKLQATESSLADLTRVTARFVFHYSRLRSLSHSEQDEALDVTLAALVARLETGGQAFPGTARDLVDEISRLADRHTQRISRRRRRTRLATEADLQLHVTQRTPLDELVQSDLAKRFISLWSEALDELQRTHPGYAALWRDHLDRTRPRKPSSHTDSVPHRRANRALRDVLRLRCEVRLHDHPDPAEAELYLALMEILTKSSRGKREFLKVVEAIRSLSDHL